MTVFLWAHKLTYVSVPKVACTSLKNLFFEIENGYRFRRFKASGKDYNIHSIHRGRDFGELPHKRIAGHVRLTLVRDPLSRLLSCYSNRVVHYRELSAEHAGAALDAAGLAPDPDLATFVRHLDGYRAAVRSIHRHAKPLVEILGTDPAYFTQIYPLSAIGDFAERVRSITGADVELRRMQTGGPKLSLSDLGAAEQGVLRNYYAADYEAYGRYF